jgi:hypothetical protein
LTSVWWICAGGAQDHAHAFRHFELLGDVLSRRRSSNWHLAVDAAASAVFGISTE